MRIACTGSTGRVGRLLVQQGVVPLLGDITKPEEVKRALESVSTDVVIHLAGLSNVDYCEQPEHWEEVRKINFNGTVNVVKACQERNLPVIYISSDHVFSGKSFLGMGGGPYRESHPISRVGMSNYALTKVACEALRYAFPNFRIIRTSYLFDWVRIMTDEIPRSGVYSYPTFIRRSYLYLPHFVKNLIQYAQHIDLMPPILHLAGSKTVSQYQFMREFVKFFHIEHTTIDKRTRPYPTGADVPLIANRPHRAGLDVSLSHELGFPYYSYQDGFHEIKATVVRG